MASYLMVNPDRYGRFGHQTLRILTGVGLYYLTGNKLLLPSYYYFCEQWNYCINWKCSDAVTQQASFGKMVRIDPMPPDMHGNTKVDFSSTTDILNFIRLTGQIDNNLYLLPYDQGPGKLLNLFSNYFILQNTRKVFNLPSIDHYTEKPYVAIHIRRGDCTHARFPSWYVENGFYISLVKKLLGLLPVNFTIIVCTQGSTEWFYVPDLINPIQQKRVVLRSAEDSHVNNITEIDDFSLMFRANILFAAGSSFSQLAGMFGSQDCVIDVSRQAGNWPFPVIHPEKDYNIYDLLWAALRK